jgi:methyltransferase-like protein
MYLGHLPPAALRTLEHVAKDLIQMEQYMDFLRNRMFRQSLLCHKNVSIYHELKPENLSKLRVSAPLFPIGRDGEEKRRAPNDPKQLRHANSGVTVSVGNPIMRAALTHLGTIWPENVAFMDLISIARSVGDRRTILAANQVEKENYEIGKALLRFYVNDLIELHVSNSCCTRRIMDFPRASPYARSQAASGKRVTTLHHRQRLLNDFEWQLLLLLDGSHDRAALIDHILKQVDGGALAIQPPLSKTLSQDERRNRISHAVEQTLQALALSALLMREEMKSRDSTLAQTENVARSGEYTTSSS